jgi:hypothetical protein
MSGHAGPLQANYTVSAGHPQQFLPIRLLAGTAPTAYIAGLQPTFPLGQVGGCDPSAFMRAGLVSEPNNRMDVVRNQKALFTVRLLCEVCGP